MNALRGGLTCFLQNSTVVSVQFAFITEYISSLTRSPLDIVCFRTQTGVSPASASISKEARAFREVQKKSRKRDSLLAKGRSAYVPPEICFCRFPLLLFPSMSRCVLGGGVVRKVQELAKNLEESCLPARIVSSSMSGNLASTELVRTAELPKNAAVTSAALLPTAACLLIGNPEVLLQPALVSAFHFFLASPVYSLAAIDVSGTSPLVAQAKSALRASSSSSPTAFAPRGFRSLTVLRPFAWQTSGVRMRAGASADRIPVAGGSRRLRRQISRQVVDQQAFAAAITAETNGTNGKATNKGAYGASAHRPAGLAVARQARMANDVVPLNGVKGRKFSLAKPFSLADSGFEIAAVSPGRDLNAAGKTPAFPRVAFSANADRAAYAHRQFFQSAVTYDTALFLHPSIAAVQQLHILASWIAREFGARLVQEAEAAATARQFSRHKRPMQTPAKASRACGQRRVGTVRRQQGFRKDPHLLPLSAAASSPPGYSTPGDTASSVFAGAAGTQNLLSVLSLLGLVEIQGDGKGVLMQPTAEIITSGAFMHVSVEAFTLELVSAAASFVFEASFEATRHSQRLHFRLGSDDYSSVRSLNDMSPAGGRQNSTEKQPGRGGLMGMLKPSEELSPFASVGPQSLSEADEDPHVGPTKWSAPPAQDYPPLASINSDTSRQTDTFQIRGSLQRTAADAYAERHHKDFFTATVRPASLGCPKIAGVASYFSRFTTPAWRSADLFFVVVRCHSGFVQ